MRAVLQRVRSARVEIDGEIVGQIRSGGGVLVLVGAAIGDTDEDADYLARKIALLRIFPDAEGKMNLDLSQAGGTVLAVSQFTLLGDCRKGRRPSFAHAEFPERAAALFERYVEATRALGLKCETGVFGAMMDVHLVNDGPVTMLLDSKRLF